MSGIFEYSLRHRIFGRVSQILLAFLVFAAFPAFGEEVSFAGVEQFSPNSAVDGEGWAEMYDPNANSLKLLPYLSIDGMAVHEGDIVLGPVSNFEAPSAPAGGGVQYGVATRNLGSRWDDGIVYYDLNGHPASTVIDNAIDHIESNTSIRFVPRTTQTQYVRFIDGSGCWSYIGRLNGSQDISIQTPGCNYLGTVSHEIYHALGVYHEQSRSDRDTYVTINWNNITSGFENNFNIAGNAEDIGPYDFGSIMHYGLNAFSNGNGPTIEVKPGANPQNIQIPNRTALSSGDIHTVQTMYYTDISIALDTVQSVNAGATVSVDITVDNPGNDPQIGSIIAKDVKVTLPIPNQTTYDGFSSTDSWNCQLVGQNIECDLAILDRNTDTALTLDLTAPNSGSMQFDAVVSASNRDPATSDNSASATVTISGGANNPPVVSITSPTNGSSFVQGASITFNGTASDTEDGNISGNIAWSSSRDGNLGTGASFSLTTLTVGTHTITASITDSDSTSDSATRTLTVTVPPPPNTPPTVTITSPANGSSFVQDASITFTGTASDAEDGNISSNIAWSSNLDGNLGSGASRTLTSLSIGTHTIIASVTDSGGLSDSKTVTLDVTAPANVPPMVSITGPAIGASFQLGDNVNFTGNANDAEDGDISSNITWSSNLDSDLGAGANINVNALSVGTHIITASITDSGNETVTAQITLTVSSPTNDAPIVIITSPTDNDSVKQGDIVNFMGEANDAEDGDISSKIAWSSDLDGDLGTGTNLSLTRLSVGTHRISANITDSANAKDASSLTLIVSAATGGGSTGGNTGGGNSGDGDSDDGDSGGGSLDLFGLFFLALSSLVIRRARIRGRQTR